MGGYKYFVPTALLVVSKAELKNTQNDSCNSIVKLFIF